MKTERLFRIFGLKVKDDNPPQKVDSIVGIGAGLGPGGNYTVYHPDYSPQAESIVVKVTNLFLTRGGREQIFFSGGFSLAPSGSLLNDIAKHNWVNNARGLTISHDTESQVMQKLAQHILEHKTGKPLLIKIAIETESRNTLGNVEKTLEWLQKHNYHSAIIVGFWGDLGLIKKIFLKKSPKNIRLYFINAPSRFGGNVQPIYNHSWLFLTYILMKYLYYKVGRLI